MKRVLILAEGQTEETFVNRLLAPALVEKNIAASVTRIATKTDRGRRKVRGGHAHRYDLIRRDVRLLLRDSNAVAVTTMLDLYGLPDDFPGQADRPQGQHKAVVEHLESRFAKDIDSPRFVPNLVLHELEGLLFSKPEAIQAEFPSEDRSKELLAIAAEFTCPEEINEGKETAPSKRLEKMFPRYDKVFHGTLIALRIGLPTFRSRCPHFDSWLSRLESL